MAQSPRGSRGGNNTQNRGNRGGGKNNNRGGRGEDRNKKPRGDSQSRGRGRAGRGGSAGSNSTGFLQAHRNQNNNSRSNSRDSSPNLPGSRNASPHRGRSASPNGVNSAGHKKGKSRDKDSFSNSKNKGNEKKEYESRGDPRLLSKANTEYERLKKERAAEIKEAIRKGEIIAPGKQIALEDAITIMGTCEDMCPEFERVERFRNNGVNRLEKAQHDPDGPLVPAGERMVKEFKRPDAGKNEQLPSDIRTPQALVRTMEYLIDEVINKEPKLITTHNFIWDRTRAVRNDFSIMQVQYEDHIRMAVDCHERTARFLILSLHILSTDGEEVLKNEPHFDAQQDIEQLNNTFTSLWNYYDDNRMAIDFPNEPEFRSYQIIFEIMAATPDIENRAGNWAPVILSNPAVQTAQRLHALMQNPFSPKGPLRPFTPDMVTQSNGCAFWDALSSSTVSYLMACVAEMSFYMVRFGFLKALWKSVKSAPKAQQAKMKEWTVSQLREYLGFDHDNQVEAYCLDFDLGFYGVDDKGEKYLDFGRDPIFAFEIENAPKKQVFSHSYVEAKRFGRSFASVIHGHSVAQALRLHEVTSKEVEMKGVEEPAQINPKAESTIFFPETTKEIPTSSFVKPQDPAQKPFGEDTFAPDPLAKPFLTSFPGMLSGKQTFEEAVANRNNTPTFYSQSPFAKAPKQEPGLTANNPVGGATSVVTSTLSNSFLPPNANIPKTGLPATNPLNPFAKPPQPTSALSPGLNQSGPSSFQYQNPFATHSQTVTTSNNQTWKPPKSEPTQNSFVWSPPAPLGTPSSATGSWGTSIPLTASESTEKTAPVTATEKPATAKSAFEPPQLSSHQPTVEPAPLISAEIPVSNEAPAQTQPAFPTFSFSGLKSQATSPLSPQKPAFSTATQQPSVNFEAPPEAEVTALSESKPSQATLSGLSFKQSPALPSFDPKPLPAVPPPAPISNSSHKRAAPQVSTTPPTSPPTAATPNKKDYVDIAARLALTQPNGLLHEYLEYSLEKVLPPLIKQHVAEVYDRKITQLKTNTLRRKFGRLWRRLAYESALNRRAVNRRAKFSETLKMEADKKRKREDDLHEIMAAMQDSKRIKEEQRRMKEEAEKAEKEEETGTAKLMEKQTLLAGKKRKSLGETSSDLQPPVRFGSEPVRTHKRSRTLGSSMLPPPRPTEQVADTSFRSSIFSSGHSSLGQLSRSSSLRDSQRPRSDARPQQDKTRTDFFRNLAAGIDPETPLVPLTQAQVVAKAKKEKLEHEATSNANYNRRRVGQLAASPKVSPAPRTTFAADTPSTRESTPRSTFDPAEADDLIRQVRQMKEMMAEASEWFKENTTALEKEYQDMKLRSSTSSQGSPRISVNGVDYAPLPGPSMSRTERLIRGYGLDKPKPKYKPLSGGDYVPIPMSKRTAARYQIGVGEVGTEEDEEIEVHPLAKKRRKHVEVDRSYRPDTRFDETEDDDEYDLVPSKGVKDLRRHALPAPRVNDSRNGNPFNAPHFQQDEELYEYEEDELLEGVEGQPYQYQSGMDGGDTEDMYEEDEEEDDLLEDEEDEDDELGDDDEEEEEEDYEFGSAYFRPGSQSYGEDDAATPATQVSHVSSGPGASKEDAIALSDSD